MISFPRGRGRSSPWTILRLMAETIPSEASIVNSISRKLKQHERTQAIWFIKMHGSGMGRRGVPDIIGSIRGRFFALEVKRPKVGVVSESQKYEMQRLANAGASVAVVESVEDVIELLGLPA